MFRFFGSEFYNPFLLEDKILGMNADPIRSHQKKIIAKIKFWPSIVSFSGIRNISLTI